MPFGDVIEDLSRTESITLTNSDFVYPIIVSDISVSGAPFQIANEPASFPY